MLAPMTTATMNISLPAPIKEFIEVHLKAGGYSATSEYVREIIRRDQVTKAEVRLKEMLLSTRADDPGRAGWHRTGLDCVLSCELCGRGVPSRRPELGENS